MPSTNKTEKLNLTQYTDADVVNLISDYNIDMKKLDQFAKQSSQTVDDLTENKQTTDTFMQSKGQPGGLASLDSNGKLVQMPTCQDVGAVPTSRTINSKSLSGNITLNAKDVHAQNHNLLINADFKVWQRGESFTAPSNAYTADRWLCNGTGTVTRVNTGTASSDGLKVTGTVTLKYLLEDDDFKKLQGKQVTQTISKNGTVTTKTFTVSSQTLVSETISNTTVNYVKVEVGNCNTPFVPRPYAEELAMCERYYCTLTTRRTPYKTSMVAENQVSYFQVDFGKTMRIPPSIAGNVNIYYTNGDLIWGDLGIDCMDTRDDCSIFKYIAPENTYIGADLVLDAEIY